MKRLHLHFITMLDKQKNYTVFLTPKIKLHLNTYFKPEPFLQDKKIIGLQIFGDNILTKTPDNQTINNRTGAYFDLTLIDADHNVIIDAIDGQVFNQHPVSSFAWGGNIVRFKPFIVDFQSSFITITNALITNDPIGFNFYYL